MINKIKSKLKNNNLKELLQGSLIAFLFKVLGMGLGYLFTLLVARWYGSEVMGLYALSITILNIFVTFGVFGFNQSLVKFAAEYNIQNKYELVKESYQKMFYFSGVIAFIMSVILYINAVEIAENIFHKPRLGIFLQLISIVILPLVLLKINTALFQGLRKIKIFSFLSTVGLSIFNLVGLFIIVNFFRESEVNIIFVQISSIVFLFLLSFVFIKKHTFIFQAISKNLLSYYEILKVSFPMLLTSTMTLIMGWTDILMIGIFQSEADVGVYSVILKLAGLTSIILLSVNTIMAPKIVEYYTKKDFIGLEKIVQNSTNLIIFSSLPIIMVLTLFPTYILDIFGKEFLIGIPVLLILMFGQMMNMIVGSVGIILIMTGKQTIYNKIMIFSSLLNIILNYFLINMYGIVGAAYSTAISTVVLNIVPFILIKYYYGFYTISVFNMAKKGNIR